LEYRRKIGLVLKKTFGRFLSKWNKLRKGHKKAIAVYGNVQEFKINFI